MEKNVFRKNEKSLLPKALLICSILFLALLTAKLYFANQLATTGVLASSTNEEIQILEEENKKLQNEVSSLGSIAYITAKSDELGLKKVSKFEILRSNIDVAFKQ